MIHLSGREALCENALVKTTYANKGISIPALQCSKDCPFEAVCAYTLQFNNPLGNIRVMMHNEYFNPPAIWSSGITAQGTPNKTQWSPDFIIIDEDIFQKEQDHKEDRKSRFASIRLLLDQLQLGKTLEQTVVLHRQTFINDGLDNILPRKPLFQNGRQYLRDMQAWNRQRAAHSILLDNLMKFAITEEASYLQGLRYESKPGRDDALIQSQIKPIAERHRGIPTLYLDATAHPNVIQRLLPQVEFHAIRVQSRPDIHLYQLCNATITQQDLRDETRRNRIIAGLKRLIQPYRNPGLITYMKVPGISSSMDELLAQEIGVPLWGHFGALRGVNKFDEVDCLIVLGRYCLNLNEMESYAYAIFNRFNGMDRAYLDSPVRMKDGSVAMLNSLIQTDPQTRAIAEHFSLSETLQALGRGRLVHGQPKDIYYLSNEYLGPDLEVSEFRTFDELFPPQWINAEQLEALRETGFVQDKGRLAAALGITDKVLRVHRVQIEQELRECGFIPYQVKFKDRWRNRKSLLYFVADTRKLEKSITAEGGRDVDLRMIQ